MADYVTLLPLLTRPPCMTRHDSSGFPTCWLVFHVWLGIPLTRNDSPHRVRVYKDSATLWCTLDKTSCITYNVLVLTNPIPLVLCPSSCRVIYRPIPNELRTLDRTWTRLVECDIKSCLLRTFRNPNSTNERTEWSCTPNTLMGRDCTFHFSSFPDFRTTFRHSKQLVSFTTNLEKMTLHGHQENLIFTFWYFLVLFGAFL